LLSSPVSGLVGVNVLFPGGLNTSLYLDVNRFARSTIWAHGFMNAYALWLGLLLLGALLVGLYVVAWWLRLPRVSVFLLLSVVGIPVALGIALAVSHATKELRPYVTHPNVLVLADRARDYAFPSDHATMAGVLLASTLFALVLLRAPRTRASSATTPAPGSVRGGLTGRRVTTLGVLALVLSLLICFGRVYVGAHYPGDVVAGLLLGALVVALLSLLRPISDRVADRLVASAAGTLLRRPPADLGTGERESLLRNGSG
jgi:undecaprenyl-diphosphatase